MDNATEADRSAFRSSWSLTPSDASRPDETLRRINSDAFAENQTLQLIDGHPASHPRTLYVAHRW